MKLKSLFRVFFFAALIAVPFVGVRAQDASPNDDGSIVLFGENYTLGEGKTLNGSALIFGGNFDMEENARVSGSIMIFGGKLSLAQNAAIEGSVAIIGGSSAIDGAVNGDIAVFGGQVFLEDDAVVNNVSSFGGQVKQQEGATVNGQIVNGAPPRGKPTISMQSNFSSSAHLLSKALKRFGWALLIAAIGMLLSLFLNPQLNRVANTITRQPLVAGGYGLIIAFALPIALVVMLFTIILTPVAALVGLLVPLLWLFGAIALGQEVGERFAKALNQVWSPALATGIGVFLLMVVVEFSKFIPCVGWIPSALIALIGVGACVLTLFEARIPQPPVAATEVALPPPNDDASTE